jgi:hypothetical protein
MKDAGAHVGIAARVAADHCLVARLVAGEGKFFRFKIGVDDRPALCRLHQTPHPSRRRKDEMLPPRRTPACLCAVRMQVGMAAPVMIGAILVAAQSTNRLQELPKAFDDRILRS